MSELAYGEQVDAELPERPHARSTGGLPTSHSSDFRELASLDQINEHVPLVVGENREIPGLTDPDLITRELNFRAGSAPGRAQQYLLVIQCVHLLPFMNSSRSM